MAIPSSLQRPVVPTKFKSWPILALLSVFLLFALHSNNSLHFPSSSIKTTNYQLSRLVTHSFDSISSSPPRENNTLFSHYIHNTSYCPVHAFPSHLRSLVSIYPSLLHDSQQQQEQLESLVQTVQQNDTLTIHVCLSCDPKNSKDGDPNDEMFLRRIRIYTKGFRTALVILSGKPTTSRYSSKLIQRVTDSLKQRKRLSVKVIDSLALDSDARAYVFSKASNVVVHRDAEAALLALISNSTSVFATEALRPMLKNDRLLHFISPNLRALKPLSTPMAVLSDGMGPVRESCCDFAQYGHGDGAKIMCDKPLQSKTENCWVLSIGCGGRWDFESDIIARTECSVHVFDCTGDFVVPSELVSNVKHSKLCVGANSIDDRRTWNDLLEIGAKEAGLPSGTLPIAVKMDVEGWEFNIFRDDTNLGNGDITQIVMEVHSITGAGGTIGYPYVKDMHKNGSYGVDEHGIAELFQRLRTKGFELVHRADNPFCGHCSEVTLLHRNAFPALTEQKVEHSTLL